MSDSDINITIVRERPSRVTITPLAEDFCDYEFHLLNLSLDDLQLDDFLSPENFEALSIASPEFYWYIFPGIANLVSEAPRQMVGFLLDSISPERIEFLNKTQNRVVQQYFTRVLPNLPLTEFDLHRMRLIEEMLRENMLKDLG